MNRRAFLSFLSVAPVAVPMVATGAVAAPKMVKLRIAVDTTDVTKKLGLVTDALKRGLLTADEARAAMGLQPVSWVEWNKIETVVDDLRDQLVSSVIGDNAQHALVSPESETKRHV